MKPEKKEKVKSLDYLKHFMKRLLTEKDCGRIKIINKV